MNGLHYDELKAVMKILKKAKKTKGISSERALHLRKFLVAQHFFKAMHDTDDELSSFDEVLRRVYYDVSSLDLTKSACEVQRGHWAFMPLLFFSSHCV